MSPGVYEDFVRRYDPGGDAVPASLLGSRVEPEPAPRREQGGWLEYWFPGLFTEDKCCQSYSTTTSSALLCI